MCAAELHRVEATGSRAGALDSFALRRIPLRPSHCPTSSHLYGLPIGRITFTAAFIRRLIDGLVVW